MLLAVVTSPYLKGLVLSGASRTSHVAILAAGRELPAVVGCGNIGPLLEAVQNHTAGKLFLDASAGRVTFALLAADMETAAERVSAHAQEQAALSCYRDMECMSADGTRIWLYGNIMEAAAAEKLGEYGADGVGLFRTEFLYMNRSNLPTEEEQFSIYRAVVRKMGDKPVTIRTMDLGADKQTPALDLGKEENPFLGFRAIRVCLARPDIFRTQLRAILRASAFGRVKVMFPMISSAQELDQALDIIGQVKADLRQTGLAFDEHIPVGIMVEVPSTAILAHRFIQKVDFFSIGSNDLTQYTLAVDRMNERIASLYNATDPAVLTLIYKVVCATEKAKGEKMCSLCGEMGADPQAIPILLGLGLRHISVNPSAILRIKKLISGLDCKALREQVRKQLEMD